MNRRWLGKVALVMGCLALTACGPTLPIKAGLKQAGADIFFGRPTATPPAPPPPPLAANIVPNFPAPLEAPPRAFGAPPLPPVVNPPACPDAAPTAFPTQEAGPGSVKPPADATYAFRYNGRQTFNPGTPQESMVDIPTMGTRHVTAVSAPGSDGSYTYDVVESFAGITTTNGYRVYPFGPGGQAVTPSGAAPAAGVYLTRLEARDAEGNTDSFIPQPPVEIAPFPAQQGQAFQGAGVDPSSGQVMQIPQGQGTVTGRARVNACGRLVDSWEVVINGQMTNAIAGSAATKDFVLTLNLATQYGGIFVGDHLVQSGTDTQSGRPYKYDIAAVINTVPQDAP